MKLMFFTFSKKKEKQIRQNRRTLFESFLTTSVSIGKSNVKGAKMHCDPRQTKGFGELLEA